jgi:ankyrin repeat protein
MLACTRNNLDTIKLLVNSGSNIYIKNKDGWNAFHIAVRQGHIEIVEYFLSIDSNFIQIKTNNLRTVLHTAGIYRYAVLKQFFL